MRCLVVACCLVAVQAATISKDIPVQVVYDGAKIGVRNLDEKVQLALPQDHLMRNGVDNLAAKIQLSPEELNEAFKRLPIVENIEQDLRASAMEHTNSAAPVPGHNLAFNLVNSAEEIVFTGLRRIKENAERFPHVPTEEAWKKLNTSIGEFFQEQKSNVSLLKQDGPTNQQNQQNQIIQNIINNIQHMVGNFTQSFQQGPSRPGGAEDEQQPQQPGLVQGFVNYVTGGFQQISTNIQSITNSQTSTTNTVLGDSGVASTTQANIFVGFVNQVSQILSGNNQGINSQQQQQTTGNGSSPVGGIFNQINQVVSSWRPTPASNGTQGDEGVPTPAPSRPLEVLQQIGSQVGSAINQLNIFSQQPGQQKPPGGAEDEGVSSTQPPNFFQNVIQNLNPFRPQNPSTSDVAGTTPNPIVQGAQSVGTQIQQIVQGQGGSGNPIASGVQTATNQLQQVAGELVSAISTTTSTARSPQKGADEPVQANNETATSHPEDERPEGTKEKVEEETKVKLNIESSN